jgi:phosphatidylserine synthase
MMNRNIPTIEISGDGYSFKKLLGISLVERNIMFLSAYGFKAINFNCEPDFVPNLGKFITNSFFLKNKDFSFSINLVQNSIININSNDIYNYNAIKMDRTDNILERIIKRKIANVGDEKDMRIASDLLFKSLDKPEAQSIFVFTNYVNRPLGKFFTYFIVNLNITPNFISFFSLIMAVLGSVLIMSGNYNQSILGIVLIQLSASLDCTDGPVARLKYLGTSFGGWLDSIFDKIVKFILYIAIGVGLYKTDTNEIYLYYSMALLFGNSMTHLIDFTYKINFPSQLKGSSSVVNKVVNKVVIRNILNSDLNILGFACIAIAFNFQEIYLITLMVYFNFLWITKMCKKYAVNLKLK